MSGACLEAARAALEGGCGRPCRLLWSPISLGVLYQAGLTTWQFGTPPAPAALPSWLWPPAVFTAVVAALAEALLRDLAAIDDAGAADGASFTKLRTEDGEELNIHGKNDGKMLGKSFGKSPGKPRKTLGDMSSLETFPTWLPKTLPRTLRVGRALVLLGCGARFGLWERPTAFVFLVTY